MWDGQVLCTVATQGVITEDKLRELLELNTTTGPLLRQNTSKWHAERSKGPGQSRLTRHPQTCVTEMDDVLGNFGRKRGGSGSDSSPLGSPTKKTVTDPGRVRVELEQMLQMQRRSQVAVQCR